MNWLINVFSNPIFIGFGILLYIIWALILINSSALKGVQWIWFGFSMLPIIGWGIIIIYSFIYRKNLLNNSKFIFIKFLRKRGNEWKD